MKRPSLMKCRFFGPLVEEQLRNAVDKVDIAIILEKCGHSLSLEQPWEMSCNLKEFIL
jgi:hypothetical protein